MPGTYSRHYPRLALTLLILLAHAGGYNCESSYANRPGYPGSLTRVAEVSPDPPALVSSGKVLSHISLYRPGGQNLFVSLLPLKWFRGFELQSYSLDLENSEPRYSFLSFSCNVCRGPPKA